MSAISSISRDPITLRPVATAIGTTFDAAPVEMQCAEFNRLTLLCTMVLNTATNVILRIEVATPATGPNGATVAPVAADWHILQILDPADGSFAEIAPTMTASGSYAFPLEINSQYVRVSAKTTLGPGTTTLLVKGVFGNV